MTPALYDEAYRPQFHFSARQNWLNDPNGLVFYNDEYHLFFQHNPTGIDWGNMTWGHAVSTDLVHWQELSHALEPDRLGTMFSGSAVVDWQNTAGFQTGDEKPIVLIYTAAGGTSPDSEGQPFTQCIAYSNDRGRTWTKYPGNPVLPNVVGRNRDPKVVWLEPSQQWIMALYLDQEDFAFFSSPDLKQWRHLQTLTMPGCSECPDFCEIPIWGSSETKWVFTAANGHYLVGSFDGERFTPETDTLVGDWGANFYAVQTYSDIPFAKRRIQIAWMRGGKYPGMPFNQQMGFPCELTLHQTPDGLRLFRLPVKEISELLKREQMWAGPAIAPGENLLAGVKGDLLHIDADLILGDAKEVGFRLRGQAVTYDVEKEQLSCLGRRAPLAPIDGHIRLQVLLDRASIETFGGDGAVSMTSCFLPQPEDLDVELFAVGGTASVASLRVRELKSAWTR